MEETVNTNAYSDIFKHIKEIRNAKEQSKLVVFVGAGISANSGLPSWEGLIKDFAEKLGYDVRKDSDAKEHFCSDEYLKIPQYSYNKNPDEYLQLLEAHFGANAINAKKPNLIHELIFKFSPAHIITTNYDPLIEKCDSSNRDYYTVVSNDKELLEKGKSAKRLILKMHGDYKDLKNIVLKEDDLRYEQKRALTSTFIKSLLVNHTFLFIGYSINDYNFKQIIDWIEYLSEQVEAERDKMPTHFVIKTGSSQIQEYDKKYLKQKRIELLNANDLPESYIEESNAETLFTLADANQLYAAMNAVLDPMADISILGSTEALLKRLRVFDDFKYIPYPSLIKALNLKGSFSMSAECETKGDDESSKDIILGWHRILFLQEAESSYALLKNACEAKPEINDYFFDACFCAADLLRDSASFQKDSYKFTPSVSGEGEVVDETYELFSLYLNNEYSTLLERANNSACQRAKVYYNVLCSLRTHNGDIAESLKSLACSTKDQSAFFRLLDKINWFSFSCFSQIRRTMPDEFKQARQSVIEYFESLGESEQNAFAYIYDWLISSKSSQLTLECLELLEKQESFYSNLGISKSNPYNEVNEIARIALCFYNFIKFNHVILDDFSDTTQLFWVYARAVLITYKPQNKISEGDIFTAAGTTPVKIDEFTLDIIVKYSQHALLREYIIKHRLSGFRFSSNNNAVSKFANLCASNDLLYFREFDKYFKNFCLLLRHSELSEEDESQLLNALDNFKLNSLQSRFEDAIGHGFHSEFVKELLLLLANFEHKQKCACAYIDDFIARLCGDKTAAMAKFLAHNIYYKSFQLLKNKICEFVAACEDSFTTYDKIALIVDGFLQINENDINNIKNEVSRISQKKPDGFQTFPDYDKAYLELCLVLKFHGKIEDISFLEVAKEKYPFLNCVFQPEDFDVAAIDFQTSLWMEFFENAEYREKLLSVNDNKEKIKESLVRTLNNGNAGHAENQIFFRHFWR